MEIWLALPGQLTSMSSLPVLLYSEKYGVEPQLTTKLPFGSSSVLPRNSAWKPEFLVIDRVSLAVCFPVFSVSTSARDGPFGTMIVPDEVNPQQWSSKMLTWFLCSSTSCCHWNCAPLPNLKLECLPPSVHSIPLVVADTRYAAHS